MSGIAKVKDEAHDVIRLGVKDRTGVPHAECSCGWKTEPNGKLLELAEQAFDHSSETGHVLRRPKNSDY